MLITREWGEAAPHALGPAIGHVSHRQMHGAQATAAGAARFVAILTEGARGRTLVCAGRKPAKRRDRVMAGHKGRAKRFENETQRLRGQVKELQAELAELRRTPARQGRLMPPQQRQDVIVARFVQTLCGGDKRKAVGVLRSLLKAYPDASKVCMPSGGGGARDGTLLPRLAAGQKFFEKGIKEGVRRVDEAFKEMIEGEVGQEIAWAYYSSINPPSRKFLRTATRARYVTTKFEDEKTGKLKTSRKLRKYAGATFPAPLSMGALKVGVRVPATAP